MREQAEGRPGDGVRGRKLRHVAQDLGVDGRRRLCAFVLPVKPGVLLRL